MTEDQITSSAYSASAESTPSSGSASPRRHGKKSSKSSPDFSGVWQGRILSLELFRRNFLFIVVATGMMLMYIGNKFECQSKMQEVIALKSELENARTDCVNASARYNSMIRESHMKAYVDTMHIDINSPEQPPYHLTQQ